MKDEIRGTHLTGSYAIRSESKLIYTSVQMEDDELLMERCVDSVNPGLLCVGLLEQSGWSYASNVRSRACPVPEQLIFKPEAQQLHWFSVQPASQMHCGSESLTAESKGTRTSRTAPGGSDWRLRDSYMWWVENNSLLGTLIKQFCSDRRGGYRPTLQT